MPIIKAIKVTEESRNSVAAVFNLYADRQDKIEGNDELIDEYMGGYIVREHLQLGTFLTRKEFEDNYRFIEPSKHPWSTNVERIPEEPDSVEMDDNDKTEGAE